MTRGDDTRGIPPGFDGMSSPPRAPSTGIKSIRPRRGSSIRIESPPAEVWALVTLKVQLGSLFQAATRSGYGTGLDEDGHLVEFRGDWRALAVLPDPTGLELVFVELEDWPLLAVDGALRLPLNQAGSA